MFGDNTAPDLARKTDPAMSSRYYRRKHASTASGVARHLARFMFGQPFQGMRRRVSRAEATTLPVSSKPLRAGRRADLKPTVSSSSF